MKTYPTWEAICKAAERAGGHRPDAIAPAVCFDLILWDDITGELWTETHIAADYDDFRQFHDCVHCAGTAWDGHLTPDDIVSSIAAATCPDIGGNDTPANCPCNPTGIPMCHKLPLCRHAQTVKRHIQSRSRCNNRPDANTPQQRKPSRDE